ncbi:MAG: FkbM family methyltransferase [Anaerolineae bacterium]|nr:FkbM family methyltransferase [Anaerolineae bacterium]
MILPHLKYIAKQFIQPRQYKLRRIYNTPRYTPIQSNILGSEIIILDGASFFHSYKEIFEQEIYAFSTKNLSPTIIDGGANIGLSTIYLKKLFPTSKVYAFEPDPNVFKVLEANIRAFGYSNVELINKALWHTETIVQFMGEGADAGHLSYKKDIGVEDKNNNMVQTTRLCNYLHQEIDFLKLDIEGAEVEVVLDCSDYLQNVRNIFVEYHSFEGQEQRLDELLCILNKSGFRVQIHSQFASPQPLLNQVTRLEIDFQLNIFGYRPLKNEYSTH